MMPESVMTAPRPRIYQPTLEQRAAAKPDVSVWVAANAGSGKTQVLIDRVIKLLLDGADPAAILCVTYTKAAAAEMAGRLFSELSRWAICDDAELRAELGSRGVKGINQASLRRARQLFAIALESPGGLKILTLHAFCEKLLQLFPVEGGLPPGFSVMEERQRASMIEAARIEMQKAATADPAGEIASALTTVTRYSLETRFEELLGALLKGPDRLQGRLDGADVAGLNQEDLRQVYCRALGVDPSLNSPAIAEGLAAIDLDLAEAIVTLVPGGKKNDDRVRDFFSEARRGSVTPDNLEPLRSFVLTNEGGPRRALLNKAVCEAHPDLASRLARWVEEQASMFALHDLLVRAEASAALLYVAKSVMQAFETEKRKRGLYDFDDLISRTRELLRGAGAAQWVLYKLDSGLKHVLVDEAQDTSPGQWDIVSALTDEFFAGKGRDHGHDHGRAQDGPRTVFVVGDRKQSIYSFQGADVEAMAEVKAFFQHRARDAEKVHPFDDVPLSVSYRSTPEVLNLVDAVFHNAAPARQGLGAGHDGDSIHQTVRSGEQGIVRIWPVEAKADKSDPSPWIVPAGRERQENHRRILARKIAREIKSWLGMRQLPAEKRAVGPGDILILFRRRGPMFGHLIQELTQAGVPVAGADRLELGKALVVKDLLALGQFLVVPEDDYSLACVLKSPLVPQPVTDDQLLVLRAADQPVKLWDAVRASADPALAAAASLLAQLFERLPTATPFELFQHVLERQQPLISARLGSEAADAVQAFLDLALDHERAVNASLSGFLNWFAGEEVEIKREMEKASGEVRLMTVHGAKGLEASIVILPDAADIPQNRTGGKLLRIPQGEVGAGLPVWFLSKRLMSSERLEAWRTQALAKAHDEYCRLLYVALTRARDELHIFAAEPHYKTLNGRPNWYDMISEGLEASGLASAFRPVLAASGDSVRHYGASEAAALPRAERAEPEPAWVTPAWLLQDPPSVMVRSARALTAIAAAGDAPEDSAPEVADADGDTHADSAAARDFGVKVHHLLEFLPDIAPDERLAAALQFAAAEGLPESYVRRITERISHADLAPFFADGSRAEAHLRFVLGDDSMVSGRIDRIAFVPGRILLLDYKTARRRGTPRPEDYEVQQMRLYVHGLKEAYPDAAVEAYVLWLGEGLLERLDLAQTSASRQAGARQLQLL